MRCRPCVNACCLGLRRLHSYRVLMNLRTDEFQGFHELSIRRDALLTDSFSALNQLTPDHWRRKLKILFKHEDGMDAGGLSKDWCELVHTFSGVWGAPACANAL